MNLVPAKCTNCGGMLEVDSSTKTGKCKYCDTQYITQDVINYYTTFNFQNTIPNIPKLKQLGDKILTDFVDDYIFSHNDFELDDCNQALEYYKIIVECDETNEYNIKYTLCNFYIRNNSKSKNQNFKSKATIEAVKNFIVNDEKENEQKRKSEYAILFYLAHQSIRPLFPIPKSNAELSGYLKHITLLLDFNDFMTNYKEDDGIRTLIQNFSRSYDIVLYQIISDVTLNHSDEQKKKIKELGLKIKDIYTKINSKYGVSTDVLNITIPVPESEKKGEDLLGCYIATCVYGSYDCPQVWTLRRYRDYTLSKTWYGRLFISFYYSVSPTIVKVFGDFKLFKTIWRKFLDRKIKALKDKGYKDTPYKDLM